MKRSNRHLDQIGSGSAKKRAIGSPNTLGIGECFRPHIVQGLSQSKLDALRAEYAKSRPYPHGVLPDLMNDDLLRSVRKEVLENVHFTEKETDIYKIKQSGDLVNLDGLEDSALKKLPSLLKLRNALYSQEFRNFISYVADSGPLSGTKTDMAINMYTPGCHLLCHDDVIGTRRLSYILYLTDPEKPWQAQWGGALRLYMTRTRIDSGGKTIEVPDPFPAKSIPPAWNQLSYFTIQPGKSFHDVEEVYAPVDDDSALFTEDDGGRVRMAISGWFHIPQPGELGYEAGLEEKLVQRSSLAQLESGRADEFDWPLTRWRRLAPSTVHQVDQAWTEKELDWMVHYINPLYLIPSNVEELLKGFQDASAITVTNFLNEKLAAELKATLLGLDKDEDGSGFPLPPTVRDSNLKNEEEASGGPIVGVARPPHKHRYSFRHAHWMTHHMPTEALKQPTTLDAVLDKFLPSQLFTRWLSLSTGLNLTKSDIVARRFRRGRDYTLASSYEKEDPVLDVVLNLTPTDGWSGKKHKNDSAIRLDENEVSQDPESDNEEEDKDENEDTNGYGGYELYMVGEEDENLPEDTRNLEPGPTSSSTGTGHRGIHTKADPAVYRLSNEDEEDPVLFCNSPDWNTLSIVLRDKGLLRFVKYLSKCAPGDRWDIAARYEVDDNDADEDVDEKSNGHSNGERNGNEIAEV